MSTGAVMPDQRRNEAPCNPEIKGRLRNQDHGSKSEPSVGMRQVGGPSELGDQAISKRAKRDHDGPNARSSQHH